MSIISNIRKRAYLLEFLVWFLILATILILASTTSTTPENNSDPMPLPGLLFFTAFFAWFIAWISKKWLTLSSDGKGWITFGTLGTIYILLF